MILRLTVGNLIRNKEKRENFAEIAHNRLTNEHSFQTLACNHGNPVTDNDTVNISLSHGAGSKNKDHIHSS